MLIIIIATDMVLISFSKCNQKERKREREEEIQAQNDCHRMLYHMSCVCNRKMDGWMDVILFDFVFLSTNKHYDYLVTRIEKHGLFMCVYFLIPDEISAMGNWKLEFETYHNRGYID